MKLAVVGSRSFDDYELMKAELDKIDFDILVSGGARGADSYSEFYATRNNKSVIIFKPDWTKFGKRAGYLRNIKIVNECNQLVAFWDGISKGTKHSIDLAESKGKLLKIVYFEGK